MTRIALFIAGLAAVLSASTSRAEVAIAPPPREIRADGSRDPAPAADPASKENPAEVVDRIIKNSKVVGDRLARTDTGTETRGTQAKILKDIDALINRQDNPPPQGGSDSKDKNDQKNQDKDKSKDNKSDMSPKGGKDDMPKKGDMPPPKGGEDNKQANSGRKPRNGSPPPKGSDPGMDPAGGSQKQEAKGQPDMNPKDIKAGPGGPAAGTPMGKTAVKPSLPIDDDVVKEVWGHLPDKLRQQVTQYYKEQFMPKYADLIKQYYSSLANSPSKPDEPRRPR